MYADHVRSDLCKIFVTLDNNLLDQPSITLTCHLSADMLQAILLQKHSYMNRRAAASCRFVTRGSLLC